MDVRAKVGVLNTYDDVNDANNKPTEDSFYFSSFGNHARESLLLINQSES